MWISIMMIEKSVSDHLEQILNKAVVISSSAFGKFVDFVRYNLKTK